MLEPQHGGTYPPKCCSTHQDDVSHTLNRQTAPKTTKVGDVFSRCPFILSGTCLGRHGPHGPIGLELFYTCFRYRSRRQRSPKCPLGCSVEFSRRGTIMMAPKTTRCCTVPSCGKNSFFLHCLPFDLNVRKEWINFIFNEVPDRVSKNLVLCSLHFTTD